MNARKRQISKWEKIIIMKTTRRETGRNIVKQTSNLLKIKAISPPEFMETTNWSWMILKWVTIKRALILNAFGGKEMKGGEREWNFYKWIVNNKFETVLF